MHSILVPAPVLSALLVLPLPAQQAASGDTPAAKAAASYGHSAHGEEYDQGPRQRPWKMTAIGKTSFPVTTSVPEVQQWYDQGNTLLHSFWYFEAERAFRWCIKLDPDCAMAYIGLLRCRSDRPKTAKVFLEQAVARKAKVSERERRFIEAWEKSFLPTLDRPPIRGMRGMEAGNKELTAALERLVIEYPDDVETKMMFLHHGGGGDSRAAKDAILQQVLQREPDHPGAHHLRIHNWDSIEFGHVALDSCRAYGPIAPQVGHANHMPGHIYTKIGMWHEGAISLDAATRVEKAYMRKRLVFPFNAWNYSHNRNFLAYAQSMLGLPSLALQGAQDMLNAPLDPKYNSTGTAFSVFGQGMGALRRTLVRFERWDEILEDGRIPWREDAEDRVWRRYCEALAHLGKGDVKRAEALFQELRIVDSPAGEKVPEVADGATEPADAFAEDEPFPGANAFQRKRLAAVRQVMSKEVEARLRLAKGEVLQGLAVLQQAAELEFEYRKTDNDPPPYPRCLYVVLGEQYLELGSPRLAVGAFEKGLEVLRNNGFALSGLARAWHALGDRAKATGYYARMLHVWSGAEPGIWQNEKARALGLTAEPRDESPGEQRNYATETLARLGPKLWQPYAAPRLAALDVQRKQVTLDQFRGKNVLLVFYLSDQCVHCVEQLQAIEKRAADFARRDTVLLAISVDTPEKNAKGDLKDLPFRILSDSADHANAIRFLSYDEFEGIELHSTNLVDRQGRLRWARTGGDPFMDMDFLLKEIDRIERLERQGRLGPVGLHEAGGQRKTGGNRR